MERVLCGGCAARDRAAKKDAKDDAPPGTRYRIRDRFEERP